MTIHELVATYTTVVAEFYNPRNPRRRTRIMSNGESYALAFNWGTEEFTTQIVSKTRPQAFRAVRTMVQA